MSTAFLAAKGKITYERRTGGTCRIAVNPFDRDDLTSKITIVGCTFLSAQKSEMVFVT
jgi:hypothetical protein